MPQRDLDRVLLHRLIKEDKNQLKVCRSGLKELEYCKSIHGHG